MQQMMDHQQLAILTRLLSVKPIERTPTTRGPRLRLRYCGENGASGMEARNART